MGRRPQHLVKLQHALGNRCTIACGTLVTPVLLRLQTQLGSAPTGASTTLDKLASGLQVISSSAALPLPSRQKVLPLFPRPVLSSLMADTK